MAKYPAFEREALEEMPQPKDPRAYCRQMVLRHAEEMSMQLKELEEQIAHVGSQLDNLKEARDILSEALRSTEKVRSGLSGDETIRDEPLNPGRF